MKNQILQNAGIKLISQDDRICEARLRTQLSMSEIVASQALIDRVAAASQWSFVPSQQKHDNFNFQTAADIMPRNEDYVTVKFRAISKTIVPGHWIDWSKGDVLKESVPKLLGQTVYPNHDFTDINNWLGSVAAVQWDEEGAQAGGVPGINAEYKIDALMNPRIARGLLMKPPAIHSTSMTVLFKFEPSHPDIFNENRWRFFELMGEEVEGEIVRLIVTEILEYWEAGLVFQGADRLAKQQSDDDEEDFAGMSATQLHSQRRKQTAEDMPPPISNQEKTMKLTAEQKAKLGIEFDGDDVPETEIFKAAESLAATNGDLTAKVSQFDQVKFDELSAKAAAGDKLVAKQRAEVTRLAKLAELGAEEGDLAKVVAQQIEAADADTLVELESYYKQKAADRFPAGGRSSKEDSDQVEGAGGVKQQQNTPTVKVGLH